MKLAEVFTPYIGKRAVFVICLMVSTLLLAQTNKKSTTTSTPPPPPKSTPQTTKTQPSGGTQKGAPGGANGNQQRGGRGNQGGASNGGAGKVGNGNGGGGGKPAGSGGSGSGGSHNPGDLRGGSGSGSTSTGGKALPPGYKSTPMQFGGKGATVIRDKRGTVRDIHHPDFDVHRGLRGERRIERRVGRSRVVAMGRGRGFYERPYVDRNGHQYFQRTYMWGGRRYAFAYRAYDWHGQTYYRYAPAFYYHPAFYGWAYRPWGARVYYAWAPAPWYGPYGYYFAPAPFYPGPSFWLTDYVLAENLNAAYAAQSEQGAPTAAVAQAASGQVVLSPEVKQAIANEVQAQLQAEAQAASAPGGPAAQPAGNDDQAPPALDSSQRTFVVSSSLDVTAANGQECALTAGDVIVRTSDPQGADAKVNVLVQASKSGDCTTGSIANVQVADLQEMHNQFRRQIDAGMGVLAKEQGTKGLPPAPDTGTVAGEVPPPAPDSNVDTQIQTAQDTADKAEKQASVQQTSELQAPAILRKTGTLVARVRGNNCGW